MKLFLDNSVYELILRRFMCVFSILMFLAAVMIAALLVRQKRYRLLCLAIPLLCLAYFMEQCFDMSLGGAVRSAAAARILNGFFSLSDWMLLSFCFVLGFSEALFVHNIHLYERNRITTMSVKEAIDSLPTGILCYAPGARVLLVNRAMEEFCRSSTGTELSDGEEFYSLLHEGALLPDCARVSAGGELVIILPDKTAWKIGDDQIQYEKYPVRMLIASEITEEYGKTQDLQLMREKVENLGKSLRKVNREIVALTAEREILNAKIRIHDELGSNLLAIKRFLLSGGTEKEKAELTSSLSRSVFFLKNDSRLVVRDEYELLIGMAERLGLTISVTGELPRTGPSKQVIASAIHECLTNTIRHAHGDELHVEIREDENTMTAVFTNNGDPPENGITEKGGLAVLRELTEQIGGSMTTQARPEFRLTIKLPKEVSYGV